MFDVVALGESLIDFTPCGINEMGMQLFARNPGGAPANVLAMYAKLGGKTAFIGKVGADDFGVFLKTAIQTAGIDVSGLLQTQEAPTTLAFVQLNERGDRSFTFYRKPGADICLKADEVKEELLQNCRVFHFGSVSLTDEPCRTATLSAAKKAKASGAVISYDPNYRPLLWSSEKVATSRMLEVLPLADILKVSEEEMVLLTGETARDKGAIKLAQYGAVLVIVTLGSEGAFYYAPCGCGKLQTYDVKTVDTTGAGDAFWGALLYCLAGKNKEDLGSISKEELEKAVDFANAAGSLTTTTKGAIPAMPTLSQINNCMHFGKHFDSSMAVFHY